jgi:hypothetical protein
MASGRVSKTSAVIPEEKRASTVSTVVDSGFIFAKNCMNKAVLGVEAHRSANDTAHDRLATMSPSVTNGTRFLVIRHVSIHSYTPGGSNGSGLLRTTARNHVSRLAVSIKLVKDIHELKPTPSINASSTS